jgi:hypothetical protein
MELSQNAGSGKNSVSSCAWKRNQGAMTRARRGAASFMRNVENAIADRIERFLYRKIQEPNCSRICYFMLFLLSGRNCETG